MIVGVLFWISNLTTLIGGAVTGAIPSGHDALTTMYPHANSEVIGTLIAHINDVAIIGYAVALFPVLKRFSESLALAYVAFKVAEGILLLVAASALLSLIALSRSYVGQPASGGPVFSAVAETTLAQEFWAARLATLAYLVATPILNYVLYRTRLVPRWVSILGFVGVAGLAIGLIVGVGDPTRGFQPGQLLVIPIILWELVFATWLIVRGFADTARSS